MKTKYGLIAALTTALGVMAPMFIHQQGPAFEAPTLVTQNIHERIVSDFLLQYPEPREEDFTWNIEGKNQYWQAKAQWWETVPWGSVAGQWGCTTQGVSVSFNPVNTHGVITAGYGGVGRCSPEADAENLWILSIPKTRSVLENE